MNKRLSFPLVLCIAALGVGCDDNGGGCPTGMICIDGSTDDGGGGGGDAGPGTDAGPTDGGGPAACGTTGTIGGACRRGACGGGLDCAQEMSTFTWGTAFGINAGAVDEAAPGGFRDLGTPSDLPISAFPNGGQCTTACDTRDTMAGTPDTCASDCATCSNNAGVAPITGLAGVRPLASRMDGSDIVPRDANGFTRDGVCRANCAFDPATNGGCPTGYTCDPGTNICVEACLSDAQCAATAATVISPNTSLVILDSGDGATCNTTTGRCDYPPSAGAGLNTACDTNADCPASGVCLIGGYCGTLACGDATGTMAGPIPCATGGECLDFGGNNGTVCIQGCMSPSDCNPGQACSPLSRVPPSGNTGICIGVCESNSECRSSERCELVRESPALSVCSAICDPDPAAAPVVADAITCADDEACVQDGSNDYGFCEAINQICGDDSQCNAGQACRVDDGNLLGVCENSCATNADCTAVGATAECVIFDDMVSTTPPLTRGVCRLPGGACAKSPVNRARVALQPMLGDAQCIASQHCSQTTVTDPPTTGTCVDD